MAKNDNKVNTVTAATVEAEVAVNLPTNEAVLESVEVKPVETKETLYEVRLTKDFRAFLGDQWWDLKAGTHKVPEHVKARLKKVGLLSAI